MDFYSLGRLIEYQLKNEISGFVVNGTTAESPTLKESEVKEIYHFVRKEVGEDYPLILGTGSNSTEKTILSTKKAVEWGANGALIVTPYYNKPTQRGLIEHFDHVARQCRLPILLYNVPSRTAVSMELETLIHLYEVENIVGIKEASGDLEFGVKLMQSVDWLVFSGDDGSCLDLTLQGAQGVISVLSHLIPRKLSHLIERAIKGDNSVIKEKEHLASLLHYLYIESNPIPVKMGLYKMGLIDSPELRRPLTVATEKTTKGLMESIREME